MSAIVVSDGLERVRAELIAAGAAALAGAGAGANLDWLAAWVDEQLRTARPENVAVLTAVIVRGAADELAVLRLGIRAGVVAALREG